MMKLSLFAAVAGLTLVSASPPPAETRAGAAAGDYPPCSRTVTDRCIQLHERGVKAPAKVAGSRAAATVARGGPYEAAPVATAGSDYPPCSATVRDRCNQLKKASPMRSAAVSRHRIRAAGERG